MPSFLRPSAQRCIDFLSHPNAYVVQLPTDQDLYFTLPFNPKTLDQMRPQELRAIHNNLDMIRHEASMGLGIHTLENVPQVISIISGRLSNYTHLGLSEMQGWMAGEGFPVFDDHQHPVDFDWIREATGSKRLHPKCSHPVPCVSFGSVAEFIHHNPGRPIFSPANNPIDRSRYGGETRNHKPSKTGSYTFIREGETRNHIPSKTGKPVIWCGAPSVDFDDSSEFLDPLAEDELELLEEQFIQCQIDEYHGMHRTSGPYAHSHSEPASQGSWIDVESIGSSKTGQRNCQTKDEPKNHSPKPSYSFEDLYQRGLISYNLTAETNTLVPHTDLHLLKLYKAMRNQGSSERDAMQEVMQLKQVYPRRQWLVGEKPNWTAQEKPESMAQSKAAQSLPESDRRERLRVYIEAKGQKTRDASAVYKSKKAKERSRQNKQQAVRFQDHMKQFLSSSPVQESIKESEHSTEPVRKLEPWESRRNINDDDSNAYRIGSFEEPIRLCTRPRAVARPSSYHGNLADSTRSTPYKSSYQAYAEDSPEDSPRAAPGSWRDV